jgi:hypothetical protein
MDVTGVLQTLYAEAYITRTLHSVVPQTRNTSLPETLPKDVGDLSWLTDSYGVTYLRHSGVLLIIMLCYVLVACDQ